MRLSVPAGTSWEGVRLRTATVPEAEQSRRRAASAALLMLAFIAPVIAVLALAFSAGSAQAHFYNGNSCITRALKPDGYTPSGGANLVCERKGSRHYFKTRLWIDLRFRPDNYVAGKATRTTAEYRELRTSGYDHPGYYYFDAFIEGHDYDQSRRTYYY